MQRNIQTTQFVEVFVFTVNNFTSENGFLTVYS